VEPVGQGKLFLDSLSVLGGSLGIRAHHDPLLGVGIKGLFVHILVPPLYLLGCWLKLIPEMFDFSLVSSLLPCFPKKSRDKKYHRPHSNKPH